MSMNELGQELAAEAPQRPAWLRWLWKMLLVMTGLIGGVIAGAVLALWLGWFSFNC